MKTIYEPKGKAKEYGELALNIYNGCSHRCEYCYAPSVLKKDKDAFHNTIEPREHIVNAVKERLSKGDIKNKEIFLCFTCDPFPMGVDHSLTLEIIKIIKESGNHVAILTKGNPDKSVFDLLDKNDRYGATISCSPEMAAEIEPGAATVKDRLEKIKLAKKNGIKTFVSFEPVYETEVVYDLIKTSDYIDEFRIGKLNYFPSDINWKEFGFTCESLCKEYNRNYMIKIGLLECMNTI